MSSLHQLKPGDLVRLKCSPFRDTLPVGIVVDINLPRKDWRFDDRLPWCSVSVSLTCGEVWVRSHKEWELLVA